jgi:hypothetical protein
MDGLLSVRIVASKDDRENRSNPSRLQQRASTWRCTICGEGRWMMSTQTQVEDFTSNPRPPRATSHPKRCTSNRDAHMRLKPYGAGEQQSTWHCARPQILICAITASQATSIQRTPGAEVAMKIKSGIGAAVLFLITMSSEAYAARQHRPGDRISCSEVRYYVARYSAAVVEMYARSHGATNFQIQRARRCLASNETAETGQPRSFSE